jgi:putative peptidoglycan lipid II flippase
MVLLITTVGRMLGFVREVLISSSYGTSGPADAFFTVQQLPTIMAAFVFGPFMIAFIPYYAALREAGSQGEAVRGALRVTFVVGVVMTGLMVVGGTLFSILGAASPSDSQSQFGVFAVILAWSVLPLLVTGLASVVLHARGQNVHGMAIAALTPAGMLVVLLVLTVVPIVGHSEALPWSFVAGAAISGMVGVVVLRRNLTGESSVAERARVDSQKRQFRKQLFASSLENVGFSLNQALTVWLAAGLGGGAVATFAYGFRLSAFGFSTLSPVNTWIQTWMTRDPSHRDGRKLYVVVATMAGLVAGIGVVVILAARPLVDLVYLRGSFSEGDAVSVAALLTPLAIYGVIVSVNQLMARYFFVHQRGQVYSRVMIAAYVVGIGLKVAFIEQLGLSGIVWGSVVAEGVALAYFLLHMIRRGRLYDVSNAARGSADRLHRDDAVQVTRDVG